MPCPAVFIKIGQQIIINGQASPTGTTTLLRMDREDPLQRTQACDPVLASVVTGFGKFIADQPIPKPGFRFMNAYRDSNQMHIITIPLRKRGFELLVILLSR